MGSSRGSELHGRPAQWAGHLALRQVFLAPTRVERRS